MPILTMGAKGLEVFIVSVETDISRGLYEFNIVGLGDKTVSESRSRLLPAIKNSGFRSPKTAQQKITVLLSPASVKKEGSHFDLPIAISYLQKCGFVKNKNLPDTIIVGELSLGGKLQRVKNILLFVLKAKELGYKNMILPEENIDEAKMIDKMNIFPAKTLLDVVEFLKSPAGKRKLAYINTGSGPGNKSVSGNKTSFNIDMVIGQEGAKRALQIALAGKHNIAFYGPPGVGKSLIAKSVTELLPSLTSKEEVECRIIHENCGFGTFQKEIYEPPFRDPHHTSNYSSIIGTANKTGEVSLAHNGILFMDEFAEFERKTLEALRQPLEDGHVKNYGSKSKKELQTLPADCILIAAMNLCKCGNYGSSTKKCLCTANDILRYAKKISGPLADRIDMWVALRENQKSHEYSVNRSVSAKMRGSKLKESIAKVRLIQKVRILQVTENEKLNKKELRLNVVRSLRESLDSRTKETLQEAITEFGMSLRGADSLLMVAKTIADLEDSNQPVTGAHILEALSYRKKI